MNIMAVDCNEKNLNDLCIQLQACYPKAEIKGFSSRKTAEEYIAENQIDVLYVEAVLNEQYGILFAEHLKKQQPEVFIHILAETERYVIEAIRIKADNYIVWPITLEKIKESVLKCNKCKIEYVRQADV